MRIFVATWSRRQVGGTETYLGRIIALLAATHTIGLGYEVDEPAGRPPIAVPKGVDTFQLHAGSLERVRSWKPDVIYAHGLLDPDLEEELLGIAPAVFFAHSYYGTCISGDKTHKLPIVQPCGRTFGVPCLALYFPRRCGGLNPLTMLHDYRRQRRRLALLRRYAAAVTHSEHMRRELEKHGAADGRIRTVGFVVSGGDVTGPECQAGRDGDGVRLTFAGRMDRLKGGDYLLKALPAVHGRLKRPLHVTLAGDGPERSRWERLAREVVAPHPDMQIEFPGWLGHDRLNALLDASDVLAMPSLWPEPYGLAGIEANRRGVPVVAFATGGIPEWLTDGVNGCLAPANPPTPDGLAAALVRCLTQLASDPAMRDGARRMGHAMPDDAHVNALVDVLTSAARERTGRTPEHANPRAPEPPSPEPRAPRRNGT